MRNQWHGDNRDLVKWGAVFHLVAASPRQTKVVYVPMLTPDDPAPGSHLLNELHPLPEPVITFFRGVDQVAGLQWPPHVGFAMVPGVMLDRAAYFVAVGRAIDDAVGSAVRVLVLLDPDTGIEPASGANSKHVRRTDLAETYARLRAGDVLAVYQHRWRDEGWLTLARGAFAEALGIDDEGVSAFTCPTIASDVAMLVVEKKR